MKDKEFDKKIEQVEDYIKCEMDKVVEDFMAGRLKETSPEYSREKYNQNFQMIYTNQ